MEDSFTRMELASLGPILSLNVCLGGATWIATVKFRAVARHLWHFVLLGIRSRLGFSLLVFSVEVLGGAHGGDFLLLYRGVCVLYCARLPEASLSSCLVICVLARAAPDNCLKLVPLIHNLVAASPPFFQVVENWFA